MNIIKTTLVAVTLALVASAAFAAPRYYWGDARGAYASSFGTDTSRNALVQTSQ